MSKIHVRWIFALLSSPARPSPIWKNEPAFLGIDASGKSKPDETMKSSIKITWKRLYIILAIMSNFHFCLLVLEAIANGGGAIRLRMQSADGAYLRYLR